MAFAAVLFDFDGILVDTEWAIYQAWRRTFEKYQQSLPLDIYTRCIGSDFATWSPKAHLEDLTGRSFDWEDLDARRQEEIVAGLHHEGPMPGVVAWLDELKHTGIPLAVVSSSSHPWVDGWLEKLGLQSYFTTTVCRGDAPRIKPAPDLFWEAARQLRVSPPRCLVVEDSRNGLHAAKAAGMSVWAIPNRVTACLDFTEADHVFPTMEACPAVWRCG
jgi:HAD superfamily hydrolase (TIGR01509 family)